MPEKTKGAHGADPSTITGRSAEAALRDAGRLSTAIKDPASGAKSQPPANATGVRDQVAGAKDDVKEAVTSLADEARSRLNDVVDHQKSLGADQISGVSRAVRSAADSLQETSPQVARLVQGAADGLNQVADDVRAKGVGDIIDSLTTFGRRQPLALFGGAAVIGFMLTRFLKSDAPAPSDYSVDSPR